MIHDLTDTPLPCAEVTDTIVTTNTLEDASYDTCVTPLTHSSNMAKITLEMFGPMNTSLQVVTAVSNEASCNPPGVVLAAETAEKSLVECLEGGDDNSYVDFRVCRYECLCNSSCAFVHIYFYDLHALSLQNTNWQLCDLQICFP